MVPTPAGHTVLKLYDTQNAIIWQLYDSTERGSAAVGELPWCGHIRCHFKGLCAPYPGSERFLITRW
jgi:hypothetical protein